MKKPIRIKNLCNSYVEITLHFDNTKIIQLLSLNERQELAKHFQEAANDLDPETLSYKEKEAQESFTDLRDEILNLEDDAEINEILGIIDNHTPEWV